MKEVLDKITSYNLFNYLLPGIIFAFLATELTKYSLVQEDITSGVFIYYFMGLVVSRFGSLVIEPLLKRISFLKFKKYKDFIAAVKADPKIDVLSEANNTYRTFTALFLLLLTVRAYELVVVQFPFLEKWDDSILLLILMSMFLFSYRKQTRYVTERVQAYLDKQSRNE